MKATTAIFLLEKIVSWVFSTTEMAPQKGCDYKINTFVVNVLKMT
jgi:hypothetical protein